MNFKLECWYRYNGGDEKDFKILDIEADTLELAEEEAKKQIKYIFKIIPL